MKKLTLITLFFAPLTALAAAPNLVKCLLKNAEWSSTITLDAAGTGSLQFKKSGNKNNYDCELKTEHVYDGQRAVVSNVTFKFERGHCKPELNELEEEIFEKLTLIVEYPAQAKPTGRVQWLKQKQPDTCVVESLNLQEIAARTKKTLRKTASEPKKGR